MSKNRNGSFTPPKGKPSGNGKETVTLKDAFAVVDPEEENELRARYLDDDGQPAANVDIKHANRGLGKQPAQWKSKGLHAALHDEEIPAMSKEILLELANFTSPYCVTISLPVHQAGMEVNQKQDAVAFKQLLQQAQHTLMDRRTDSVVIEHLLKPAWELLEDTDFWNNQADGLAVFLAPEHAQLIRLPYQVKTEVYVGRCFLISTLVAALKQRKFYLLALSKHDAQFYEGDAFGLQRRKVPGLPNGIADVVHLEEKQDLQLFRQGSGGHGGSNFHGHAEGQQEDKANLEIYFREVDKTLFAEVLHTENAPMVLGGVEYLLPIYRSVSRYGNIATQGIIGNQEHESEFVLFDKAQEIVRPYFDEPEKRSLKNYYDQTGGSLTVSGMADVVPAAYYGQVSDLFVCDAEHVWGHFDPQNNRLDLHESVKPDSECLIDRAIVETYRNGGTVHLLDPERMPHGSTIAALLRYDQ